MSRKIYYIPMVHTAKELGEMEEATTKIRIRTFGAQQTREFLKDIDNYWELVVKRIRKAGLHQPEITAQLHIFVDGLPNGAEEAVQKTVATLVSAGEIPSYKIIGILQTAGATVHGTEDIHLVVAEANYWKAVVEHKCNSDPEWEKQSLKDRDKAIIARVHDIVPENETAIVFIGRLHNVVEPLTEPPYNFEFVNL